MAHTLKGSLDQGVRRAKMLEELTGVLRKFDCTLKEGAELLEDTSKMLKRQTRK